MKVDFATFCHKGDADKLHMPGQLKKQVESNEYRFNEVIVIYQLCNPKDYILSGVHFFSDYHPRLNVYQITDLDDILLIFGIDIDKCQYVSDIDTVHTWKNHVTNHLKAVSVSKADYIVFADADCWMVEQPEGKSWVEAGIEILENNPSAFIVSPNDGEPERRTLRMSQQMFLARVDEFRSANFNQPGYSGNPRDYDTMPEYHAMLEGRMEYHCRESGQYRYVLAPEYRYWHHQW
jgi:hypothetical protein